MKKFNEFNQDYILTDELKSEIDNLSHTEMASIWRFGDSNNIYFQGEVGDYFKDRLFKHFGGFNPSISKGLGWSKNENVKSNKKINLEEILKLHCNVAEYDKDAIILAMKKACSQILELAAENATLKTIKTSDGVSGIILPTWKEVINKQSILNTIEQIF